MLTRFFQILLWALRETTPPQFLRLRGHATSSRPKETQPESVFSVKGRFGSFILCHLSSMIFRPAQFGTKEWKHKISIRSHHDLRPDDNLPPSIKLDADLPGDYEINRPRELIPNLCYSCHTAWTSKTVRGNPVDPTEVPVPVWVSLPNANGDVWGTKVEARDLQETIKEFLLDPGSQK